MWFAGLISMTGDWMLLVALPITVYELTDSAVATGFVLIANKVLSLLLGSFAGVLVDRWDRQRTMIAANLIRAPILLLLFAVDSADRVWIVYLVSALLSAIGQFFRPAENALLPTLVGEDQVIPANALNALNDNLARLIGPALGGLCAAWFGLSGVAGADAVTYVIAAGMIAAISVSARPETTPRADASGQASERANIWHEWKAGLHLVRSSQVLRVVFGVFAIASFGEGIMGTAFWVYVDQALHGGSKEAGWLMSAQAIGGIAGGILIGARAKTQSPIALLGWGAIGLGVIDLMTFTYPAFLRELWPGLVFMAIVGIPAAAFGAGYTSAIQVNVDDAFRGRVFGALLTTSALLMIVGAAFAGPATQRFGAVAVLSLDSVAYVVAGVIALRMPASARSGQIVGAADQLPVA